MVDAFRNTMIVFATEQLGHMLVVVFMWIIIEQGKGDRAYVHLDEHSLWKTATVLNGDCIAAASRSLRYLVALVSSASIAHMLAKNVYRLEDQVMHEW